MDRVEQVVNWILDEGMYCILNVHHDGGHSEKSWILDMAVNSNEARVLDQFTKVWNQIAMRFRDSSEYLILESMNEVGFDNVPQWNERYRKLNLLNQTFVNTVRATGSVNATRPLLIAGYWTDIVQTVDARFLMPQDTVPNKLLVSVHYYTPATFCIADDPNNSWGFRNTWGTTADYNELNQHINRLKVRFIDNGIPVIMGEYGVTVRNKEEASRARWMTAVAQACIDNGIIPVLWDTGLGTGGDVRRRSPFDMTNTLRDVMNALR